MYPIAANSLRDQSEGILDEILDLASFFRSDIEAALINDPATSDPIEVIYCYPGFEAIRYHR